MKKNLLFIQVITLSYSVTLSTICLLNSTRIADASESHTIGFLSAGGSFSEIWLASEGDKKHRILAAPNGSLGTTIKIDDREILFKPVSHKSVGDIFTIGSRFIEKSKSDKFQLIIDLRTIKVDRKNCLLLQEGFMTISTKNWSKKMKVKSGSDPCG